MAERPAYKPIIISNSDVLYDEVFCEFQWFSGYSVTQKQKSIESLHDSAISRNINPIIEISSKSPDPMGVKLSAFNLLLETKGYGCITVESAFQGSKKFSNGGPYIDFYGKNGRSIKKDSRLKESGRLVSFEFEGVSWQLEPVTAFYDWLYIKALSNNLYLGEYINQFDGFTDIEFNPKKSINCQAKSCALFVSLQKRGLLQQALKDKDYFIQLLKKHYAHLLRTVGGQSYFV